MKTIRIERHINCGKLTCGPCYFLKNVYSLKRKTCTVFNKRIEVDGEIPGRPICKRLQECIDAEVNE